MRRWILALSIVASASPTPAQTVDGPGDNIVCGTYTPQALLTVSRARMQDIHFRPTQLGIAITGKPYSARRVSQELQLRTDGTRLCSAPVVSMNYRDSSGRMRMESNFMMEGPDGKPAPITVKIVDPFTEIEYNLNMAAEIAYRFHPGRAMAPPPGERLVAGPPPPSYSEKRESLGTHPFQGVNVEGTRTMMTGMPPGSNALLNVTSEIWIWPYVNTAVFSKTSTPSGNRIDAWLRISTAEPDPALFRVPDGWQIVDGEIPPVTTGTRGATYTASGFRYSTTIAASSRSEYVIREAPYSAEQISESSSNLNVPPYISKGGPVKLYRDSSGRTRVDRPQRALEGDRESGPVYPRIEDPVGNVEIVLDPVNRIAHRFPLPKPDAYPPAAVVQMPDGNYTGDRKLGEQIIEGIEVTGILETFRTPAGANNNDRELIETTESWYSPQLHMIVLGKTNAARGNSVIRLTHISTAEPDPALFQIPAGYTVVDEKAPVNVVITRR